MASATLAVAGFPEWEPSLDLIELEEHLSGESLGAQSLWVVVPLFPPWTERLHAETTQSPFRQQDSQSRELEATG